MIINNKGKIAMAMKGITLDVANSEIVTFDKVKNMILKKSSD